MKTFAIRFSTPEGKKQVAFSLSHSPRQELYDFLRSLQAGNAETIVKDAIISAYGLHGNRHETEAGAYAKLMQEARFARTNFIYHAIIAYLPELAQKLVAEAEEIKVFVDNEKIS